MWFLVATDKMMPDTLPGADTSGTSSRELKVSVTSLTAIDMGFSRSNYQMLIESRL